MGAEEKPAAAKRGSGSARRRGPKPRKGEQTNKHTKEGTKEGRNSLLLGASWGTGESKLRPRKARLLLALYCETRLENPLFLHLLPSPEMQN